LGLVTYLPIDRAVAGVGKLAKKGLEKSLATGKKLQNKVLKKSKPDDINVKKNKSKKDTQDDKEIEKSKRCQLERKQSYFKNIFGSPASEKESQANVTTVMKKAIYPTANVSELVMITLMTVAKMIV